MHINDNARTTHGLKLSLLGRVHIPAVHKLAIRSGCTDSSVDRGEACRHENQGKHVIGDRYTAALVIRESRLFDREGVLAKRELADSDNALKPCWHWERSERRLVDQTRTRAGPCPGCHAQLVEERPRGRRPRAACTQKGGELSIDIGDLGDHTFSRNGRICWHSPLVKPKGGRPCASLMQAHP